jgi:putative endonuclease
MYFLYIVYSKSQDWFYTGETLDLNYRLELHNTHQFKGSYTKIASDWAFVLQHECSSKTGALYLERFIKRMKSRKFIEKIIKDPDILVSISQGH